MTKVNLDRWREHLIAASKQRKSLSDYAHEHGLSRYSLYAARRQLKAEARTPRREPVAMPNVSSESPFVAVRVQSNSARLRVRLPNTVEVEFMQLDSATYLSLLQVLAALPCSG